MLTKHRNYSTRTLFRLIVAFAIGLALMLIHFVSLAQQHPIFTQYMFNGLVINPAYTGSHESMTATASVRRQWTGIKGAPQTEVASFHSRIKFSRSAAGAVMVHDKVGVTHQYSVYGTYAYHIPVSKNAKISVGGQAGVTYYNANFSQSNVLTPDNIADPVFEGSDSRFLPNLGLGIYYYSKRTYVGLSMPTLIDNKWNSQDPALKATQERHYFLSAGHVFDVSRNIKLKPNVLLKFVEHGLFQYDINANVLFHEVVWVGVSYRMKDSIDGLFEWNINDQLSFGYSYGYPVSSIASLQSGTHEFVLNYRIKKNKHLVFSPRYF